MGLTHWDDLSLERTFHDVPETLIYYERCFAMIASVLVRLRNHPRWRIRDALQENKIIQQTIVTTILNAYLIKYFSLLNEDVEAVHDFLDGCLPIPPMDVEDINVRSLQFLQAGFHAEVHRFHIVSCIHSFLLDPRLSTHVIRGIL